MAELLVAEHDEVTFVGTPSGLEARLVPSAGVAFRALDASGFDRSRRWTAITGSARILGSAISAWRWMGAERPDVVIGFGAFVSVPVGLAAVWRGIPLVLHEQNSVPGLANRILSRWAKAVGVTYAESVPYLAKPERASITGNPVRQAVLDSSRVEGRAYLGLDDDDLVLLVFGGSRGARHINTAMVALAPRLLERAALRVVHVTGSAEADSVRAALAEKGVSTERWQVLEYLDDMGAALAGCDLAVARAGATSIAEMTALGVPAVLVPYPYATDDHQTGNARTLVDNGAAVLIADAELDSQRFGDELEALLGDGKRRANMAAASKRLARTDATQRVIDMARDAVVATARS